MMLHQCAPPGPCITLRSASYTCNMTTLHVWRCPPLICQNLPTVFNVSKIRLTLHNYATIQHFNISNILKTQSIIRLGIYSPGLQSCLGSNIQYREFNIQYFQSIKFHISYPLLSYFCLRSRPINPKVVRPLVSGQVLELKQ